jgi:hypothetical protein
MYSFGSYSVIDPAHESGVGTSLPFEHKSRRSYIIEGRTEIISARQSLFVKQRIKSSLVPLRIAEPRTCTGNVSSYL